MTHRALSRAPRAKMVIMDIGILSMVSNWNMPDGSPKTAKSNNKKGDRKMKRKHTLEYLKKWLKVNGFTLHDLERAYHRNTGHRATVEDILKDSTTTWRYYLNVC
jgi:hypothetical protein